MAIQLNTKIKNVWLLTIVISLLILGGASGFAFWMISENRVYIEKAEVSAPLIDLAPTGTGVLEEMFVRRLILLIFLMCLILPYNLGL